MKTVKKIGIFVLAVCIVGGITFLPSYATKYVSEPDVAEEEVATLIIGDSLVSSYYDETIPEDEREIAVPIGDIEMPPIMPLSSKKVITNEAISSLGSSWLQPNGYSAYRVWVSNDGNQRLTVTVNSVGGKHTFYVQAGGANGIIVSNAREGVEHTIDYQTPSGALSGYCNVRVSTEDLSWE